MARIYIVMSGESLSGFDFNLLKPYRVMAVNYSCHSVPFAQDLVALDKKFYDDSEEFLSNYKGNCHTVENYSSGEHLIKYNVRQWPTRKVTGFDEYPFVCHGFNSGYTAIQIAAHLGFDDIRLLGFDCGGGYHYTTEKPSGLGYSHLIKKVKILSKELPKSVSITNYSIDSKCISFRKKALKTWEL